MRKRYSLKTMVVTAALSVVVGLLFASQLDFAPKIQAVDLPAPAAPTAAAKGQVAGLPTLTDLVKKVKPAVVNISTTQVIRMRPTPFRGPYGGGTYSDDYFERFFGTPREYSQSSLGSGFIISKDGTILTNNHVVANADEIIVKLSDARKFQAKVVGNDPKTDIAVIKIQGGGEFPYVSLGDSNSLEVGEWVVAVGNPFGLGQTVTTGIVSAKGRVIGAGPYDDFIQTDASINPGNSGGPLFNLNGEVVGINTAIIASGQGIGFATPISMAKGLVPQLIEKGRVSRGYLGVGIQDVTAELAKSFGLPAEKGALIATVYPEGPAAKGGVQAGDVVTTFNGKSIENSHDLPLLVSQTPVGSSASLEVLRKGERKNLNIMIGELEQAEKQIAQARAASSELGIVARDLTPDETQDLAPQGRKGVLVLRVAPGSQAEYVGIRTGDLILEINGHPIQSLADYGSVIGRLKAGEIVRIFVGRGNMTSFYAFKK